MTKAAINYVFVDYENVQPKNLDLLRQHDFRIFVFVGGNQTKMPTELVFEMQRLGEKAEYIRIDGNGPNALDFHIAFYIGQISQVHPKDYFHIISKDKGFDPLIRHLKKKGIRIARKTDLAEIPILQISNSTDREEQIAAIVKNLVGRGQSKPRKVKTLSNTINSLFSEKLEDRDLQILLKQMQEKKYITVKDSNVSYKLPTSK